jgi:hypothetical protein
MSKISNIETTFYPMEGENFKPFEFIDVSFFIPCVDANSPIALVAVFLKQDPKNSFYVGGHFVSAYIEFTNQLFQQVQPTNSNATTH